MVIVCKKGYQRLFLTTLLTGLFSKSEEAPRVFRCRYQLTGAAPISKETLEFFLSLGLPLYEVFGMSECAELPLFQHLKGPRLALPVLDFLMLN